MAGFAAEQEQRTKEELAMLQMYPQMVCNNSPWSYVREVPYWLRPWALGPGHALLGLPLFLCKKRDSGKWAGQTRLRGPSLKRASRATQDVLPGVEAAPPKVSSVTHQVDSPGERHNPTVLGH